MTTALLLIAARQTSGGVTDPRDLIPFHHVPVSSAPDPVTATIKPPEPGPGGGVVRFSIRMSDVDTVLNPVDGRAEFGPASSMLGVQADVCTASVGPWTADQALLSARFGDDAPEAGGDHRTVGLYFRAASVEDTAFPVESVRYFEVFDGANDFPGLMKLGDPNRVRLSAEMVIER